MLRGRRTSTWRSRYEFSVDDQPVAVWDSSFWRSGGSFELDGRLYRVRSNAWGSQFGMADANDTRVASADRVGRKRWSVAAGGQTYEFQRAGWFSHAQDLMVNGVPVGSVRRTSFWRGDVAADLPGVPLPVQIFVTGVVIAMWDRQAAGAAG